MDWMRIIFYFIFTLYFIFIPLDLIQYTNSNNFLIAIGSQSYCQFIPSWKKVLEDDKSIHIHEAEKVSIIKLGRI